MILHFKHLLRYVRYLEDHGVTHDDTSILVLSIGIFQLFNENIQNIILKRIQINFKKPILYT